MNKAQFIDLLYGRAPDGYVEVTYIAPDGVDVSPHIMTEWAPLPLTRDIDPDMPNIMDKNRAGYGVYLGMTVRDDRKPIGKRGTKNDAKYVTHLWCDIDDMDASEGLALLGLHDHPPTAITSSGGGVHGYWLLDPIVEITDATQRDEIEQTLQGLAVSLGTNADRSVRDMARVLRMPGTCNTKPKRGGVMCEIMSIQSDDDGLLTYDYDTLAHAYAPLGAPAVATVSRHLPDAIMQTADELPPSVKAYLQTGAGRGERNQRLFVAARMCNDYGIPRVQVEGQLLSRAIADGLPEREALGAISSAYRYAPDTSKRVDSRFAGRMAAADTIMRKRGA